MTEFRFPHRIQRVRDVLGRPEEAEEPDALLISNLENARYLSGFTGSNALLLITRDQAIFLTDSRYAAQSAHEVAGFARIVLPPGGELAKAAAKEIRERSLQNIAFESAHLTVGEHAELGEALLKTVTLTGKSGIVETVRRVKDAGEIRAIEQAVRLADRGFTFLCDSLRVGQTERQVAWELEKFLREQGAERLAFETIVASGPNSALPHARPTERRLGESGLPELVILDYGVEVDGYCSDITRTVVIGGAPTARQRHVYDAVLRAQQVALEKIRPGMAGKDVDAAARLSLKNENLAEAFVHSTGHGLGRVVHDGLMFSPRAEVTLVPGMVATVEPGVYVEGWGGVRIEDDIVVTEQGCRLLTNSTKELIALA